MTFSPSQPRTDDVPSQIADAIDEVTQRVAAGEQVDLKELCSRFPAAADRLHRLFPAIAAVAEFGRSSSTRQDPLDITTSVEEPLLGVLGDYQIIGEIGRGGMGVVYEAVQVSLVRNVALKVMPFASVLDPRRLQRFKNEAQAAAALDHPNIVGVYCVGCERGVHYYTMELVDGQSLAEVIKSIRSEGNVEAGQTEKDQSQRNLVCKSDTQPIAALSTAHSSTRTEFFRSIARFGVEAASALEYAHQMGIVHRDIKPSNLMLDQDGHIHITDFGLATTRADANMTLTGDLIGTARYMSPEQASGQNSVLDHRTDIYSLGITLYELLTLQSAFTAVDPRLILRQVEEEQPSAPRSIDGRIPKDLETIVLKAIAKDSHARYSTAREMSDDLQRFLDQRPILARRTGRLERVRRWTRRNPVVASLSAALSLLFLILAVGSSGVAWRLSNETRQKTLGLYARDMRLVSAAINDGEFIEAERNLLKWVSDDSANDHRGFEWYYLWQECHDPAVQRTISHRLGTYSVAFTGQNSKLAVGWMSPNVAIWDLNRSPEAAPVYEFSNESIGVFTLAAIPDTNTLITGDGDGHVVEWDVSTGERLQSIDLELPSNANHVASLSVSQDRHQLAIGAGSHTTGVVRIWDRQENSWQETLEGFTGNCFVAYVPNNRLAVATYSGDKLQVYDANTWSLVEEMDLHADGVRAIAVSTNRLRLALGLHQQRDEYRASRVEMWDTDSWTRNDALSWNSEGVSALAFSSDASMLAVGSEEGAVALLEAEPLSVAVQKKANSARVSGVAFSDDGRRLASASWDGGVRVWDVASLLGPSKTVAKLKENLTWVNGADFVDNETACITDQGGDLYLWNVKTGETVKQFPVDFPNGNIVQLAVSPDRRLVAVLCGHWPPRDSPGKLEIIDIISNDIVTTLELPQGLFCAEAAFSRHNRYLAICAKSSVAILDLTKNVITHELKIGPWFKSADFSPDGRYLVCTDTKGVGHLYGVPDFTEQDTFQVDSTTCETGTFSPDGRLFAVGGFDNRVKLFDVTTQRLIKQFATLPNYIVCVKFSPDGQRLITGAIDGKLRLWHANTGEELLRFDIPRGWHPHCAFSPDGSSIVVGCGDTAIAFRSADREQLATLSVAELNAIACRNVTDTVIQRGE